MAEILANYFIVRTPGPYKLRWKDEKIPHAYISLGLADGGYPYLQEDVMRAERFPSREDAEEELDFIKKYTPSEVEIIEVSVIGTA